MLGTRGTLVPLLVAALIFVSLDATNAQSTVPSPPTPAHPMVNGSSAGVPGALPGAVTGSGVPAQTGEVLLGGTTVTVSLAEPLSSANANVDDQVAVVVRKPVVINGYLFIAEGANGHATITSAEHSAGNGSGGKLAFTIDWVYAVDGGKVKLSQTNHASETGDTKGASSTATIATYILLGPLGLFAHNFVHGKDVTISTKQNFVVFVDHDVILAAQPYGGPAPDSTPR